jgi:hypothetical protein
MPLTRPILDDRSYEQLRDELVRRIPVYSREWTDHNPADPGITLIELFAYLGENLLYRFNQIPETAKLEFLDLLAIPLRPAIPARAMLAMTTEEVGGVLVEQGTEAKAGSLAFEISTETRVLPVAAQAVSKQATDPPDEESEPEVFGFFRRAIDALDGLGEDEEAACYENVTVPPGADGPPVDFDAAVDRVLWVAVTAAADREPAALRSELIEAPDGPLHLNLGFVPDLAAPPAPEVDPCPGEGAEPSGPAVAWEIATGRFDAAGRPVYRPLAVAGDGTRGLTRQGVVRLRLPRRLDDAGVFALDDPDLAGTGELPPALDDDAEATVLFWLRAYRLHGGGFCRVQWIGANAAECEQTRAARAEFLGTGTAQPGQQARLIHTPVVAGSLELEVEGPDGWAAWSEVDGFHASGPEDRCYVLDREAGRVRFGNGLQGAAPQIGRRIRAVTYRWGGGAAGNVAAEAIAKLPGVGKVEVTNPLAAWGGADGETVAEALDRIPGERRRRDRAVTRGDFRELALGTPGAVDRRALGLPRHHPWSRATAAAGAVTLVLWARRDAAPPAGPLPVRHVLPTVACGLVRRRLVTTELYVVPPTYRRVALAVGLAVKPGYGVEAVRRWVELVLRQYLAPLPPYGPEGAGWPLGRRVHGPELEAAALQVEGVEFLEGLRVAGWNEAAGAWQEGTVELALDEVPELAEITVVAGPPAVPGEALGPLPPARTPVPVPLVREEC